MSNLGPPILHSKVARCSMMSWWHTHVRRGTSNTFNPRGLGRSSDSAPFSLTCLPTPTLGRHAGMDRGYVRLRRSNENEYPTLDAVNASRHPHRHPRYIHLLPPNPHRPARPQAFVVPPSLLGCRLVRSHARVSARPHVPEQHVTVSS